MLTLIPTRNSNIWECRYTDDDQALATLNALVLGLYRDYSDHLRGINSKYFKVREPLYWVYHQKVGGKSASVLMHKTGERLYVSAEVDGVVLDFVRPTAGNISKRVVSEYAPEKIKEALSTLVSNHLAFGWESYYVAPEVFCGWLVGIRWETESPVYALLDTLTKSSSAFREKLSRVPIGWATGVARSFDLTGSEEPTHELELATESTRTPFVVSSNARILHEIMHQSWYELVPVCTFFEVVSLLAKYEYYEEWKVRAVAPDTGEVFDAVAYTPPNRGLSQFNDIPGHDVCWQGNGARQVSQSDLTLSGLKDNESYAALGALLREHHVNLVLASGESSLYAAALSGGFQVLKLCPDYWGSGQTTEDYARDAYKMVADWMTSPACVYPVRIATDVPSLRFAGNVVYFRLRGAALNQA